MTRNETEEAISVVFIYLKFYGGMYINGIQLPKFGLLIDRTSF